MKSIICAMGGRVTVNPSELAGEVGLTIKEGSGEAGTVYLTPDMCGALLFALETACEVMATRRDRAAILRADEARALRAVGA